MRNLFRTLCALALIVFGVSAYAAAPIIKYGYRTPDFVNPPAVLEPTFDSADSACAAGLPVCGGNCGGLEGWTGFADGPICNKYKPGVGVSGPIGSWFEKMSCPAGEKLEGRQCVPDGPKQCAQGSELVNGECQCKPGFVQGDGACYPDPDKDCAGLSQWCTDKKGFSTLFRGKGQSADFFCHAAEKFIAGGAGVGSSWELEFPNCNKGCMVSSGGTTVSLKDDSGQWWTEGTGKYVGSVCDPDVINKLNEGTPEEEEVTPPATKDPGKCNGQPGTVNGKEVCIPWSGAEGDNKSETKTNPDGSTTKTDTKTTCSGNSCTTTTTTTGKDSSGNTTGTTTTTTTTTKDDYCSKNSGSSVCGALDPSKKPGTGTGGGSGGSGSGSCEGADCEDNDGPTLPGKPAFGKFGAPEQPKLYTTKYPDGIAGVWSAKTAEIKSAPISNLVGDLMPKVADGGTPPTWIIDLDMGGIGNFGQRDISPPSWLWGVLKAITILSALLLARRLVFGG